jgi:tetratricopeptide (TPR) repeat protein
MNKKKNTLMIAGFAKATVIMLLLGLFASTLAYAETSTEQYKNVQEEYQTSQERVRDAQQSYQDSMEKFHDAKAHLEDSRTSGTIFDLKNATRNFLFRTIDYTIIRLEVLKDSAIRAEEGDFAPFMISDNIGDYMDQLKDLEDDVEAAETREEFQAVISEIRDIWQHANLESRYFILGTANNRVDSFLERGESISDRIEAEIERLAEAGVDTEKMEQLQYEYNDALQDAKDSHNKATQPFDEHNGFDDGGVLENAEDASEFLDEAGGLVRETQQQLSDGHPILREIFAELKEHRPGSADLSGTGKLTATGNGKATMSGDMEAKISARGGILTITDYDGNAEVDVTGYGTKEDIGDGVVRYSGFDGTAGISGSSVTVVVLGDDIELTAEGIGSVILRGYGTYDVEKDGSHTSSNDWAPPQAGDNDQGHAEDRDQGHAGDMDQDHAGDMNQGHAGDMNQDQTMFQNQTPDENSAVDTGGS